MKENRTFRTAYVTWIAFALCLATLALTLESLFFANFLSDIFLDSTAVYYFVAVRAAVLLYPVVGICAVLDLPDAIRTLRSVREASRFFRIVLCYLLFLLLIGNPLTVGLFGFIDRTGFYRALFSVLIPILWGAALFLIAAIHITLTSILIFLLTGNEEQRAAGWGLVACVLLDITLVMALFFILFFQGG